MKRLLTTLEQGALALSVLAIVTMMCLTAWDAVGRYLLGQPLSWAFQLTTYYLLASATYFALSATQARGDHIAIDALRFMMPQWMLRITDTLWSLAAALVMGVIAYGSAQSFHHAWVSNEFLPGDIMWPVWVAILPILLGCGVMILRLLANVWVLVVENRPLEIHAEEDAL